LKQCHTNLQTRKEIENTLLLPIAEIEKGLVPQTA
jgi:hypothetical protein